MSERFGEAYIVKGAGIVAKGFYEELESCRLHPRYKAIRKPRAACARCWILWDKAKGGQE